MNSEATESSTDQRVSETYRSLATERPPARLDREVMRMASKEARTPYAAARAWTRPFAWAAMIAICLAIVMQLTQLPEEAVEFEAPAEIAPAAGSPPVSERAAAETADELQPQSEPRPAPVKNRASGQRHTADTPSMAGKPAQFSQEPARADSGVATKTVAPADEGGSLDADRGETPSSPRRERAAVGAVVKSTAAEARSLAIEAADEAGPLCPAEVRESAARWHECIESLRDSVAGERLAAEIADFEAAFPDHVPENRPGK